MTVHHVIVAEPYSRYPDELDRVTLHHVSEGGGCGGWLQECREPHLWIDALDEIAEDEGTDEQTRDLASELVWDAENNDNVWHGQPHTMTEGEWCVPIGGCGFEWADKEYDLPPDLLPGVYDVTCDQYEWGGTLGVYLTDEPVPDPEVFL